MTYSLFAHAVYGWQVELAEEEVAELEEITSELTDSTFGSDDFNEVVDNAEIPEHVPLNAALARIIERLTIENFEFTTWPAFEHMSGYFRLHFVPDNCCIGSATAAGTVLLGFGLMAFPDVLLNDDPDVAGSETGTLQVLAAMQSQGADWHSWVV